MSIIEVRHIKKKYKSTILKDISFTAECGECIGILGANGCGKTTLLTIMAGIRRADGGSLLYNGENALGSKRICSRYVGYVPQTNPLIEELSARDNLSLWSKVSVKELLQRDEIKALGIENFINKRISTLSGGMRRRLSVAAALANRPPVLVLDEPGTALDIKGRQEIIAYLRMYMNGGGTVVLTTHIEDEIRLCTRLYVIKGGILLPIDSELPLDEIANLM